MNSLADVVIVVAGIPWAVIGWGVLIGFVTGLRRIARG